jgi:ribosomal protein S18 acetylase RimI-like enzyme
VNESDSPRIQRVPPGPEREAYLPLLLLADEAEPLRGYMHRGDLYALTTEDGEPLGATLVVPYSEETETAEVKAVAVDQSRHNRGLGQRMLRDVLADLRNRGMRRFVVGTSNAGIGQIAFYQKAGFRLWRIERDYFTPEKGYDPNEREDGLPHRDMVWFDLDFGAAGSSGTPGEHR